MSEAAYFDGCLSLNEPSLIEIAFALPVLDFTGISTLSSCGDPERLPELPPGDEQRLQRAALNLQQKLILREWLKEHRLQHFYSR